MPQSRLGLIDCAHLRRVIEGLTVKWKDWTSRNFSDFLGGCRAPRLVLYLSVALGCLFRLSVPGEAKEKTPPPNPSKGVRLTETLFPNYTYDGFTQSTERHVNVPCPYSLLGAADFLESRLLERQASADNVEFVVRRETARRLSLKIKGVRGEVVSARDDWELLFVEISLTEEPQESLNARIQRFETIGNLPPSDLREALERLGVYEVSIIVSGRFKAGGKPASEKGYTDDFEAKGYSEELSDYAGHLLDELLDLFRSRSQSFDATTGNLPIRGRDLLSRVAASCPD